MYEYRYMIPHLGSWHGDLKEVLKVAGDTSTLKYGFQGRIEKRPVDSTLGMAWSKAPEVHVRIKHIDGPYYVDTIYCVYGNVLTGYFYAIKYLVEMGFTEEEAGELLPKKMAE